VTCMICMMGVYVVFSLSLVGCVAGVIHVHLVHGMFSNLMSGVFVMHIVIHRVWLRIATRHMTIMVGMFVFRIRHVEILSANSHSSLMVVP